MTVNSKNRSLTNFLMKAFYRISIILLILMIAVPTNGQSSKRKIKTISGRNVKIKNLDKFIKTTMDSLQIPGLSIAIINDAEVVYHRLFGVKNIETKEPVDNETIFEAASLSKPLFTYFF